MLNVDEVKYGRGGENRDQNSAISSYIVYIDFIVDQQSWKLMQFFIEFRMFVDGLLVIGEDLFKDSYKIMFRDYSPQTLFFNPKFFAILHEFKKPIWPGRIYCLENQNSTTSGFKDIVEKDS